MDWQGLRLSPYVGFVARAAAWVVALFGVLRVPWVQQTILLPFARLQGQVACGLAGTSPNSVVVDLSCTGSDAMALSVGAILAYPAAWRRRLTGAALGLALIIVLNTARIGTLSLVVERRELFNLLHVYLWPAALIVLAAAYVFYWMGSVGASAERPSASPRPEIELARAKTLRLVGLTLLLVVLYYLGLRWALRSTALLEMARWAAGAAGVVMSALGVAVEVSDNYLTTAQGRWVVTQECITTPLIPVYLAAVLSLSISPLKRAVALLAAAPLFLFLGTARLLVLALPRALVGSQFVAVHAFYQVLAGAALVVLLASRTRDREKPGRFRLLTAAGPPLAGGALAGLLVAVVGGRWLWPAWQGLADARHLGHGYTDPQGALTLMPAYQIGLLVALWLALRRPLRDRSLWAGLGLLVVSQPLVVIAVGELASHLETELPVVSIRAVSVAVPLLLAWWLAGRRRAEASEVTAGAVPLHESGS